MQQLSMSIDFLVELSDGIFAKVKFYHLVTTKIFCFIFLKVRFTCAERSWPLICYIFSPSSRFHFGYVRIELLCVCALTISL
jgi:hypothetical protein